MSGPTFQQCHVMGYLTNLKWKAKKYRVSLKKLDLRLELSLILDFQGLQIKKV